MTATPAIFDRFISSEVTITESGVRAQCVAGTGNYKAVTSVGHSSGKHYFEMDIIQELAYIYVALVDQDFLVGENVFSDIALFTNTLIYKFGTSRASNINFGTGDVVGVAVNFDSGHIWFSKNNVWDGDPVAETGSIYTSGEWGLSGKTLYPAIGFTGSATGRLVTHPDDLSYTPPTGYDADYTIGPVLIRAVLDQLYHLKNDRRQLLDQNYHMTVAHRTLFEQVYGLRMLAVLSQLYGNMPAHRAVLVQEYGDNTFLRRLLVQEYGDAARYRAVLDQEWASFEGMRAILTQRYTIADHQIRAMVEANYDLSERDQVRALMDQLYVLAAGEALVQASDIAITAVNGSESRLITSAYNINIEQDEALYYMVGELQLAGQAEYEFFVHLETVVTIVIDGFSSEFIPLDPRRQRGGEGTVYVVPLVSKSVLLDHAESAYSLTEDTDLFGMAQTIVTDLAALVATVDWQMVDWFIPAKKLYANGDTAMAVIKRIVNAAGGVVQTSPDGVLICRPEYPVSVDKWDDSAPDIELTDQDDFFSIMPQNSPRDGFNRFFISDEQLGSDGLRIEEVQISARKKEVRVFMVPWDDSASITLHHSGGLWVTIIADGVRESQEHEQVEFTAGAGRVSKPVYGSVGVDWAKRDLGGVTPSEEGNLVADQEQNSLAGIVYTTRYYKFIVTDDRIEDVQVYPEMV